MHPILARFTLFGNDTIIGTYGVFMVLAMNAGIVSAMLIGRRRGYRLDAMLNYALIVAAGAVGGAFLAGFFVFLPERLARGFASYPPVLVSWGGIVGAAVSLAVLVRLWKLDLAELADIGTPSLFFTIGVGRIGCHFGGCCYGIHTTSCIGVTFTDPIAPAAAALQPLVPTQLISAAGLIVTGALFVPLALRVFKRGMVFGAGLVAYGVLRFIIEFWRDDARKFFLGLSDGQVFGVLAVAAGCLVLFVSYRRKQRDGNPGTDANPASPA